MVSRLRTACRHWNDFERKVQVLERSPTHKEVSHHLEHLLGSPDFEATPLQRALLQYLVKQALNGKAAGIDVLAVAAGVFGRGSSYDPATDPIVPIQTDGLRRALAHHYRTTGNNSPLRIILPKGTFVPTFAYGEPPFGE